MTSNFLRVCRLTHKPCIAAIVAVLLAPVAAFAQTADQPDANAKVRFGPLALNPTLALTNLGVDNNVFNEPDQLAPKSDFTMTVTPAADLWLHMGRAWLTGRIQEDLVYYRTYASERSANQNYKAGILAPLNRIRLSGNVSYLNTRDRPGFEIDARSQRYETGFDGQAELRMLSKTYIGIRGARTKINFDKDQVFLGTDLQYYLNRTVTTAGLTVRHNLTPLTTLTLEAAREQQRFTYASERDADSTLVVAGLKFDPYALIKGSATVGYRDFKGLSPLMPSFSGLTSAVDLTYVALGATKLGVQFMRDVQYSFDVQQPYYLQTGGTASIQQQVYGPFDVVARIGVQRLDYRDELGVTVAAPNRSDYVHLYGGGAGYRLGKDVRIGVNVDNQKRTSAIDYRTYSGLRFGLSVTYGS